MKHLIHSAKRTRFCGAAQIHTFICCILCMCSLGVSGQEEKSLSASVDIPVDENIEWLLELYSIRGYDWKINVELTGSVRHIVSDANGISYGFRLGEITENSIVVPAGTKGINSPYAKELEIVRINDNWQARFHQSGSREKNAKALSFAELVMHHIQLPVLKDYAFISQRTELFPDGWSEDNSRLIMRPKKISDRKPNAVLWEEESSQDETLVWWALRRDEDRTRFLRIERYRGAFKSQPSYSEFKEYVGELRELFISNKLSAEHILAYSGAVLVTICSLGQHPMRTENNVAPAVPPSREVEYVLPKEEMDELLEKYTPDHPLVRQHEKK